MYDYKLERKVKIFITYFRKSSKQLSPAQNGKRESRRISDIKKEVDKSTKGCETIDEPTQVKSPKNKENSIPIVSTPNLTTGNYENLRPGAPHYCEICGKVK